MLRFSKKKQSIFHVESLRIQTKVPAVPGSVQGQPYGFGYQGKELQSNDWHSYCPLNW